MTVMLDWYPKLFVGGCKLAFRDIINRADNFNDQEKRETNERSWSRCNATKCGRKE
jgi:hypothetical protein